MIKRILLILLMISSLTEGFGQAIVTNSSEMNGYQEIPQENIFVHYNTGLLFSGEYLYYRVYCFNSETRQLSKLSKIAYVELIGEDKNSVFKHKIRLKDGLGQGDFFIPTSVPSGNYKLVAYTQWMLNGEGSLFFQNDISIINPYLGNQKTILLDTLKGDTQKVTNNIINEYETLGIKISTNKKTYGLREKVTLNLNGSESLIDGDYSLSVRKAYHIEDASRSNSNNYSSMYSGNIRSKNKSVLDELYLPELRGELISGMVTDKNGKPASGKKVAISIPGKDFIFKMANTNSEGIFYLNLDKEYEAENAIVQVLGDDKENFKLDINEPASANTSKLTFHKFKITPAIKNLILERSIYNQIENSYFSLKPDSIITPIVKAPFYVGNLSNTYLLDDYTRFNTVKEVFVEIVDHVWIKSSKEGTVFKIRESDNEETDLLPLILMDGILIQNHDHLLEYNARSMERISVLRDKFYYGTQLFQGIIAIETKDGDYKNRQYGDYVLDHKLFKPLEEKKYFQQSYKMNNANGSTRIPDLRNQLLWLPDLDIHSTSMSIPFFTSDNKGHYEICLEGFTKNGKPVSVRKVISVE